jgi:hypothetical protein
MRSFYEGPYARITSRTFESYWPVYKSFAIRELRCVHRAQGPVVPQGTGRARARFGSTGVAGAAAVAVALGWPVFHSAIISLGALVVLVASFTVSTACLRSYTRWYELWADYHGQPVCLFQTTDVRLFGEVSRAFVRALERTPVAY